MTWKLHAGDNCWDFDDPNAADAAAENLLAADIGVKIWVEKPEQVKKAEAASAGAVYAAFEAECLKLFEEEDA